MIDERALLEQLRDHVLSLDDEARSQLIGGLTTRERARLKEALDLPALAAHQRPPPGDWQTWLFLAGRGSGKTYAGAWWFDRHMSGPPCYPGVPGGHRAIIAAPTHADAYESCYAAPSGVQAFNPAVRAVTRKGGTVALWPNGAEALLLGAYGPGDVERYRAAGNRCCLWAEELAAWPKLSEAWEQADLGLRLGAHPKRIATTTPKNRPLIKQLVNDPTVAVTRATTDDNQHLAATRRAALYEKYGGSRLGRQELEAELLEDVEGALFTEERLHVNRRPAAPPLRAVAVGVDPTGSKRGDEAGIIAAGVDHAVPPHYWVLADYSLHGTPQEWGGGAVRCYRDHFANIVVAERNYGGEMVASVLRAIEPNLPLEPDVHAARGKELRAEPIATLDQQGRLHLVGDFPDLEAELTGWSPRDVGAPSPNRLDAMVWAITWLMGPAAMREARSAVPRSERRIVPSRTAAPR